MKRVIATVEFSLQVPDTMTDEAIGEISFEIPYEKIRVDTFQGPVEGARVTGYTTTYVEADNPGGAPCGPGEED